MPHSWQFVMWQGSTESLLHYSVEFLKQDVLGTANKEVAGVSLLFYDFWYWTPHYSYWKTKHLPASICAALNQASLCGPTTSCRRNLTD